MLAFIMCKGRNQPAATECASTAGLGPPALPAAGAEAQQRLAVLAQQQQAQQMALASSQQMTLAALDLEQQQVNVHC